LKFGIILKVPLLRKVRGENLRMKIADDIIYVGVNDHDIDLFEGQYRVPLGMAYNSYLILDEKVAVFDTVDEDLSFTNVIDSVNFDFERMSEKYYSWNGS
jgi:flavorubredoxin